MNYCIPFLLVLIALGASLSVLAGVNKDEPRSSMRFVTGAQLGDVDGAGDGNDAVTDQTDDVPDGAGHLPVGCPNGTHQHPPALLRLHEISDAFSELAAERTGGYPTVINPFKTIPSQVPTTLPTTSPATTEWQSEHEE